MEFFDIEVIISSLFLNKTCIRPNKVFQSRTPINIGQPQMANQISELLTFCWEHHPTFCIFPFLRNHAHILSCFTLSRKQERNFHAITHTKTTFHASRTHVNFTQSRNLFFIFTQLCNIKGPSRNHLQHMGGSIVMVVWLPCIFLSSTVSLATQVL